MGDNTAIEWTDTTWNPTVGCTQISLGCDNCYAKRIHERFNGPGSFDTVTRSDDKLWAPLKWRRPRKVFVNSMSDLFHEQVPDAFIAQVFGVIARTPQHTYQLLTKRHGRMRSLLNRASFRDLVLNLAPNATWPLPNLWLGVSVEDQKWADVRIPALLKTPAAVRFLSCEPLLGPVDLRLTGTAPSLLLDGETMTWRRPIDWVIVGGESGHGARPMHPDWARSLRDQCTAAEVPYFFKQWGEWAPNGWRGIGRTDPRELLVGEPDSTGHREVIARMGKKAAGRELDGRTWSEYPAALTTEPAPATVGGAA